MYKMIVLKYTIIRNKCYKSAIRLFGSFFPMLLYYNTFIKLCDFCSAVAITFHFKIFAQRIHSLGTHTIQPHTLLKRFAVILGSCIYLAYHIYYLAKRYTTTVVTHGYSFVFNSY